MKEKFIVFNNIQKLFNISSFLFENSVETRNHQHRTDDRHSLGSKPTCAILLCPWERHFMALSPAWWS